MPRHAVVTWGRLQAGAPACEDKLDGGNWLDCEWLPGLPDWAERHTGREDCVLSVMPGT